MPALDHLNLAGNQLRDLPARLPPTLTVLVLAHNQLSSLPKALTELPLSRFCKIDLEGNPIAATEDLASWWQARR